MTLLRKLFLPVGPALLVLACVDEPLHPCGAESCVEGVDLALALDVEWTADQPYHELAGEHVVRPGDTVRVRYTVSNLGSRVSGPTSIDWFPREHGRTPIPPLQPGESSRAALDVVVDRSAGLYIDRFRAIAHLSFDSAGSTWGLSDADRTNDHAPLDVRVAQPALRVDVAIGDTLHLPSEVRVTVTNISTVPSTPYTLGFCFGYDICERDDVWFDLREMPSLAPGETFEGSVPVTVPPASSVAAQSFQGRLFACAALGHGVELPPDRLNSTCSGGWWSLMLRE